MLIQILAGANKKPINQHSDILTVVVIGVAIGVADVDHSSCGPRGEPLATADLD